MTRSAIPVLVSGGLLAAVTLVGAGTPGRDAGDGSTSHEKLAKQVSCPVGWRACGKECFDPMKYACFPPAGPVCPLGWLVCGKQCYDPLKDACFPPDGPVCPLGWSLCGKQCYDTLKDACFPPDGPVCPIGWRPCGKQCYDPRTGQCANGKLAPNPH